MPYRTSRAFLARRGACALAFAYALCSLASGGCSPDDDDSAPGGGGAAGAKAQGEAEPLVLPDRWRLSGDADDPMRERRAGATLCSEGAMHVEGGGVEVSTASCNYMSLVQPSLGAIAAGDEIVVRAWWGVLDSAEPALGTLAVFIGGDAVWQESVAIPGRPDARDASFASPRDYPAGAPVVFHVSNHGANDWTLGELSLKKRNLATKGGFIL